MFFIMTLIVCAWFVLEVLFAIFCQLSAPLFKLLFKGIGLLIGYTFAGIAFLLMLIFWGIPKGIYDGLKGPKKEASDANDYNYDFYQLDSYTQDLIRQAKRNNFTCVHNGEELLHVKDFLA